MGLDNRDYLRDESNRYSDGFSSGPSGPPAPVVRKLIVATIVVFVLQIFGLRSWTPKELEDKRDYMLAVYNQRMAVYRETGAPEQQILELKREIHKLERGPLSPELLDMPKRTSFVTEWLRLETPKVMSGQIWRLLTCAFCHDRIDIWHIVFNMLFLWWFGPTLESMYGSKEFLWFYLCAALTSSLSYVALDLFTGDPGPMVGASGAVMAVLALFALHYPTQIIRIMFVFPVEMRWLVLFFVIVDLHPVLLELAGDGFYDGVAHAAHLGGLAFGYAYGKRHWRIYPMISRMSLWWKTKRRGFKVVSAGGPAEPSRRSQRLSEDTDAILKKISEHGEESLTRAERKTLEKASREYRDRKT